MIKKYLIIFLLLSSLAWAGQLVPIYEPIDAGGAPGSITLVDSESLDESGTDTDAVVPNVTVTAGDYNALVVKIEFNPEGSPQRTISSVYWDVAGANQEFTRIGTGYVDGDDAHTETYFLVNPTAGENKSVTVNFSGDLTYGCGIGVFSLSGAAQSSTIRDYDGEALALNNTSTLTLTVVSGDFIIAGSSIEAIQDASWSGSDFSTTELLDDDDTHQSYSIMYGTADDSSEDVVIQWSSSTNHMAHMAVAIKVAE